MERGLPAKTVIAVLIVAANAACAYYTKRNGQVFSQFKYFGALFAAQFIAVALQLVTGFNPGRGLWFKNESILCHMFIPATFFAMIILPYFFLWLTVHVLFGTHPTGRKIVSRILPALLAIVSVVYAITEFAREQSACNTMAFSYYSWFIMVIGQFAEPIVLLVLIGSFACTDLSKLQSTQRLLLLFAIAAHLPVNRLVGFRNQPARDEDPYVSCTWYALPLFFPIVYFCAARKFANDKEQEKEEKKLIDE